MIAVRPPEYFPGIDYFALMTCADRFVLADTFQYSRQSFQNRARVRNPQGWQWITVPLKGGQHGTSIRDVRLRAQLPWRSKHWRAVEYNYRSAPYFEYYESMFRPLFEQTWTHLGELTCRTTETMHEALGLSTALVRASALEGRPSALADVVNTVGGEVLALQDTADVDARQIGRLKVVEVDAPVYRQVFDGFEPGMSALDLVFNYGPEARQMLAASATVVSYHHESQDQ